MTHCEEALELEAGSLFEASFLYRDTSNIPINLTGLVDNADFVIKQGTSVLWTGTMSPAAGVTATLATGRFDLLIPEAVVSAFTFRQVKYRFRIRWILKGWQSLADGQMILDV